MGNKPSSQDSGEKGAEKDEESCKTTSTSTLATQPSDDTLRELKEATAQGETRETKPKTSLLVKIGNALFGAAEEPAQQQSSSELHPPRVKVRLCHCETDDQHRAFVSEFLDRVQNLHGEEGLRQSGFEYRKWFCPAHEPVDRNRSEQHADDGSTQEEKKCDVSIHDESEHDVSAIDESTSSSMQLDQNVRDELATRATIMNSVQATSDGREKYKPCLECATRLYHSETNTLITEENRKQYIADGEMYEQVTRLAQECAQEAMQRAGNLEWVTVCDDPAHAQPVRALVHEDHHLVSKEREDTADDHPTLLIATGRGKVKAGIFSRRFLLTAGMESSTALPMVIEAAQRQMSVVIFDPNARGDRNGMDTFEKSFEVVLGHLDQSSTEDADDSSASPKPASVEGHTPSKRALYIVAHSASGSQLVRYMLDRVHGYLPYLRAIAFTDSTHNIQWTRKNAALQNLLGSKKCVYFRSASKAHDDLWESRKAGETVETDSFWDHRFGGIKTLWAGTEEHSLMNWFAHVHIWDHFDQHLNSEGDVSSCHDQAKPSS